MRVVFMGTPRLAATILRKLAELHDVVGVYTRPDAIRGRGKKLVPSDVKALAEQLGIPVFTPESLRSAEARESLLELRPDVVCVSAYGAILPKPILDAAPLGCLNVHTSLLPRWRGAAPIERAILAGDELTGVCIMRMEEGLDTGPYCVRREVAIGDSSASELADALANEGAAALIEALKLIAAGEDSWTEQGSGSTIYAEKIAKGELNPDITDDVRFFVAKVRASSGAHPARATIANRSLAIEQAAPVHDDLGTELCASLEAGDALFAAKRLFVCAADGAVEILRVRPDGKKSMDAKAFAGGIQGIRNANIRWERC